MYCRKCGREVIGNAELCTTCQEDKRVKCPKCGELTEVGRGFCKYCDAYIPQNIAASANSNNYTKKCKFCRRMMPRSNIYCPQCGKHQAGANGSFWVGFLLVWFVGIIGFIIAYFLDQEETWRGAKCCFKILIALIVVLLVLIVFATCLGVEFDGYNIYHLI